MNEEARHFLFEERNLDERVVRWCRLTSWKEKKGVPWLQIPFYSQEGKLIGVQNRNLVKGGLPRFRFPQGSECGIYNLPVLKMLRPGEDLYITEGSSDCWSMLSAGHKAVAIPSATLFNAKEFKKELMSAHVLENENTLHIYPDKDAAGEYLYQQIHSAAKELGFQLIRHELPEGCKDFADYWAQQSVPCTPSPAKN